MPEIQEQNGEYEAAIDLKISCPGGLKVTVDVPPSTTTVGDLKVLLEERGGPPAAYIRLLSRGKKLDNDDATLSSLGIVHRTALMAMHNEIYTQDQAGVRAIESILNEAEELKDPSIAADAVHERITQLCCRLDAVDTNGSAPLRQFRKSALSRLQALEQARPNSVDTDTGAHEKTNV